MKRTITTCDICNKKISNNVTRYEIEKHIPPYMNYTDALNSKFDICENCYKKFLEFVSRKSCEATNYCDGYEYINADDGRIAEALNEVLSGKVIGVDEEKLIKAIEEAVKPLGGEMR